MGIRWPPCRPSSAGGLGAEPLLTFPVRTCPETPARPAWLAAGVGGLKPTGRSRVGKGCSPLGGRVLCGFGILAGRSTQSPSLQLSHSGLSSVTCAAFLKTFLLSTDCTAQGPYAQDTPTGLSSTQRRAQQPRFWGAHSNAKLMQMSLNTRSQVMEQGSLAPGAPGLTHSSANHATQCQVVVTK